MKKQEDKKKLAKDPQKEQLREAADRSNRNTEKLSTKVSKIQPGSDLDKGPGVFRNKEGRTVSANDDLSAKATNLDNQSQEVECNIANDSLPGRCVQF